jgi:poly-gamma-glutamate capsule biosynthesis protein CapA/YwtB (metallophosphatase superfamily)
MKWQQGHQIKNSKIIYIVTALLLLTLLILSGWKIFFSSPKAKPINLQKANIVATVTPAPTIKKARLMAVGDMLIHDDIYNAFRTGPGDTFDFRPAFSMVKPVIQKGDFNIVNEETIIGGATLGLSGLYVANSPQELGDAFIDTGFNIIQLANNHAFDRGLPGMANTLSFWKSHSSQAITAGVYDSQAARDTIPIIEKNGVKLAFLAYAFGSNRGSGPNSFNLNIINRDLIKTDVIKARGLADIVVVGLHWGIENVQQPNAEQRSMAQFLADNGVDIVYGTHPHELQPPEWIVRADGKKTFVMYSLGNFLSIDTLDPPYTLTGAIMGLDIVKSTSGTISLENPFTLLTWNYFSPAEKDFKVMPFDKVSQTDYRWGNWPSYKAQTEDFIRQKIPSLKLLNSSNIAD